MADNEKGEENTPHAHDWEVLPLTSSTYAAAPGPVQTELNNDDDSSMFEAHEAKTSEAMLMSGHFNFPQSEPENFLLEPENMEISSINESKDSTPEVGADVGGVSKKKDDDNWNEVQFYSEKDKSLSFDDVKFKGETTFEALNLIENELSLYGSDSTVHVGENVGHEQVDPTEGGSDSDISKLSITTNEDENNESGFANEAWWKKQATALYAQAKEANAFWSIFVAATVMGLVILGQHWQLERWQILQLRWQFSANNDKMSWMMSPLSHFKDLIVGGNRRVFLHRSSSSPGN